MKWFNFGKKKKSKRSGPGFFGNLFGKSRSRKRKTSVPKDRSPHRRTNAIMSKLQDDPKKAIDWAVRNNYSPTYTDGRGVERWKSNGKRVHKKK